LIAFLEGAHILTKRPVFLHLSQLWLRIFAISFGMGVVTGIVMPFQFGTNWSRFSEVTGNIISPLLAYESLTAFFLEATFLWSAFYSTRVGRIGCFVARCAPISDITDKRVVQGMPANTACYDDARPGRFDGARSLVF